MIDINDDAVVEWLLADDASTVGPAREPFDKWFERWYHEDRIPGEE